MNHIEPEIDVFHSTHFPLMPKHDEHITHNAALTINRLEEILVWYACSGMQTLDPQKAFSQPISTNALALPKTCKHSLMFEIGSPPPGIDY